MLLNKQRLSGSTDGRAIKVVATASAGTLIHTAQAGTTLSDLYDEVWLWAWNSDSSARLLTLQFGGTTSPDDNITRTLNPVASASGDGLVLICPGFILQNADVVRAFAAAANVVMIVGYINKVSP
jgi:hypothetical protein